MYGHDATSHARKSAWCPYTVLSTIPLLSALFTLLSCSGADGEDGDVQGFMPPDGVGRNLRPSLLVQQLTSDDNPSLQVQPALKQPPTT